MKRLAIVGSGISGLGAAWLLRNHFAITLYEQQAHLGGHTNTITIDENGRSVPIDTGFMVFNHVTYPNLTRLFAELNVETKPRKCPSVSSTSPVVWNTTEAVWDCFSRSGKIC